MMLCGWNRQSPEKGWACLRRLRPELEIDPGKFQTGAVRTMQLEVPTGEFRAYLFDCDGTIVDSMPLHYIAWKKALGEWNCTFEEELFYAWGGRPVKEIIAALNEMQALEMPMD